MINANKYEKKLFWSEDDQLWVCEVPELGGCMADGDTQIEALKNADKAIQDWIADAKVFGYDIPQPKCLSLK